MGIFTEGRTKRTQSSAWQARAFHGFLAANHQQEGQDWKSRASLDLGLTTLRRKVGLRPSRAGTFGLLWYPNMVDLVSQRVGLGVSQSLTAKGPTVKTSQISKSDPVPLPPIPAVSHSDSLAVCPQLLELSLFLAVQFLTAGFLR